MKFGLAVKLQLGTSFAWNSMDFESDRGRRNGPHLTLNLSLPSHFESEVTKH